MSAPTLTTCPADVCPRKKWGKGKVSKQVGAGAGLIFKGSGFYLTDYRSEGYKEAAKKDVTPAAAPAAAPATPAAPAAPAAPAKPAKPTAAKARKK